MGEYYFNIHCNYYDFYKINIVDWNIYINIDYYIFTHSYN